MKNWIKAEVPSFIFWTSKVRSWHLSSLWSLRGGVLILAFWPNSNLDNDILVICIPLEYIYSSAIWIQNATLPVLNCCFSSSQQSNTSAVFHVIRSQNDQHTIYLENSSVLLLWLVFICFIVTPSNSAEITVPLCKALYRLWNSLS